MEHPEYPADEKGRCWTCGYLSKHRARHNDFFPVSFDEREACSNDLFRQRLDGSSGFYDVDTQLECFVRAYPIGYEIACISPVQSLRLGAVRVILHHDRKCPDWRAYTPGFSPKEHREDYNVEQLETLKQRFAEERARDSRKANQRLRRYERRTQRYVQRSNIRWVIIAILVGAAYTIAQIITSILLNRESLIDRLLRLLLG